MTLDLTYRKKFVALRMKIIAIILADILSKVYEDLNLQQSIKSSDIEKYYIIENKTKKINNIPIKGIIPVLSKYNIK